MADNPRGRPQRKKNVQNLHLFLEAQFNRLTTHRSDWQDLQHTEAKPCPEFEAVPKQGEW
jgi:hypothetical protein